MPAERRPDDGGAEAGGRVRDGLLLEWYRYPPGPPVELPTHAHAEYQLNASFGAASGVRYRGARHVMPSATLGVLMPDEAHTPVDPAERTTACTHLTLYVDPTVMRDVTGEIRAASVPAFRDPVVGDADLVGRFARLHAALAGPSSALEQDVRMLTVLADLIRRHACGRVGGRRSPASHRAVRRAREYLHDNVATNVSLADLARVGGVSPFHLARLFTVGLGMPPHSYQLQLRVARAKRLLLAGRSVNEAAHEVGFFDLSHFTRHFKRHVGTPPGAYANAGPVA